MPLLSIVVEGDIGDGRDREERETKKKEKKKETKNGDNTLAQQSMGMGMQARLPVSSRRAIRTQLFALATFSPLVSQSQCQTAALLALARTAVRASVTM